MFSSTTFRIAAVVVGLASLHGGPLAASAAHVPSADSKLASVLISPIPVSSSAPNPSRVARTGNKTQSFASLEDCTFACELNCSNHTDICNSCERMCQANATDANNTSFGVDGSGSGDDGSGFPINSTPASSTFKGSPGWIAMVVSIALFVSLCCCCGCVGIGCYIHETEKKKHNFCASKSRSLAAQARWKKGWNTVKATRRLSQLVLQRPPGPAETSTDAGYLAVDTVNQVDTISPVVLAPVPQQQQQQQQQQPSVYPPQPSAPGYPPTPVVAVPVTPSVATTVTNPSFQATIGALASAAAVESGAESEEEDNPFGTNANTADAAAAAEEPKPAAAAAKKATGATVYQHAAFKGYAAEFPLGDHNMSAFIAAGAKNDDVSSIIVNEGFEATLYQHGDFSGWSVDFTAGRYDLNDLIQKGGQNDDASSIRVRPARTVVPAPTGPDSAAESEEDDENGSADDTTTTTNPSFDPFGGSASPTNPESTGGDDGAAAAAAAAAAKKKAEEDAAAATAASAAAAAKTKAEEDAAAAAAAKKKAEDDAAAAAKAAAAAAAAAGGTRWVFGTATPDRYTLTEGGAVARHLQDENHQAAIADGGGNRPMTSGRHYWELEVVSNNGGDGEWAFGVCKPGTACGPFNDITLSQCLIIHSNDDSGSGCFFLDPSGRCASYGGAEPPPKAIPDGSKVGLLMDYTNGGTLSICFNKQPYGTLARGLSGELYPCISVRQGHKVVRIHGGLTPP